MLLMFVTLFFGGWGCSHAQCSDGVDRRGGALLAPERGEGGCPEQVDVLSMKVPDSFDRPSLWLTGLRVHLHTLCYGRRLSWRFLNKASFLQHLAAIGAFLHTYFCLALGFLAFERRSFKREYGFACCWLQVVDCYGLYRFGSLAGRQGKTSDLLHPQPSFSHFASTRYVPSDSVYTRILFHLHVPPCDLLISQA